MDTNGKINTVKLYEQVIKEKAMTTRASELALQWQEAIRSATFKGVGPDFWDKWAKTIPLKTGRSDYVEEVLGRMRLSKDDSILDVGAGTGAMTIPLAKQAGRVTALDQSSGMLEVIRKKAKQQMLDNISTVNTDWEDAQITSQVEPHDIVLASRSLPSNKSIVASLSSINAMARKLAYITWKADSYDTIEAEICKRLDIDYKPFPDYILLYNLLYSLGIRANAEIFNIAGERIYRNLDDAFTQIIRSHPLHDDEKRLVRTLLADYLEYKDDMYVQHKTAMWSLIWWKKDGNINYFDKRRA